MLKDVLNWYGGDKQKKRINYKMLGLNKMNMLFLNFFYSVGR